MSYEDTSLPFNRGETYHGTTETVVNTAGADLEGREFVVADDVRPGAKPVRLKIVRNMSGFTILPYRIVRSKAGTANRQVDGYTATTAQAYAGIVDEKYATTGNAWRDGDLGYIVVEGDCLVLTDLAGSTNNNFSEGQNFVSLTAATSGATTAGRLGLADYTGATAVLINQYQNTIGKGHTARTTGNTNSTVLVTVNYPF